MVEKLGEALLELRTDDSQYLRGLKTAETGAKRLDRTFDQTSRGAAHVASELTGIGVRSNRAGTRVTAMRMQVQQAAFQLGDFAVQVGAGTSMMRAFSLQAPQLLGAFGPAGAILGAIVAVVGGFAGALFNSGKNAKDATRELDLFRAAAKRLREESKMTEEQLTRSAELLIDVTIGNARLRVQEAERRQEELALQVAAAGGVMAPGPSDEVKRLREELLKLQTEAGRAPGFHMLVSEWFGVADSMETAADRARKAREELDEATQPPVPRERPFDFEEQRFLKKLEIERKLLLQATHGMGMDLLGASAPGMRERLAARQAKLNEGMRVYSTAADAAAAKTERWAEAGADLGLTFSSSLEDVLVNWRQINSAMDVGRALLQDFLRIMVRAGITKPLAGAATSFIQGLFGADPNAPGSGAQGRLGIGAGPIVEGARAAGGPVMAGGRYLVGERGPELFVPDMAGSIVPAGVFAGGGVSVTVNNFGQDRARVSERRGPMGQRDITVTIGEAMARDVRRGGALHGAIAETFDLSPRALPG